MKPPIIVVQDDIDVFLSVTDAERYMESRDVRRGRVRVFDSEARPIRASIARRALAEVVRLEEDPDADRQPAELKSILTRFLSSRGESSTSVSECVSLEELIGRAANYPSR